MKTIKGDGWEVISGRWEACPPYPMVDHCISDPPFTAHVSKHAKQRVGLQARFATGGFRDQDRPTSRAGGAIGNLPSSHLSFDGVEAPEIGPAIVQLVKRWTVLFCAIEQIGEYAKACPGRWVRGCWWSKTNGTPQFTGDRPGTPGEAIAVLHAPGKKRWNRGGHVGEWRGPRRNHGAPFDQHVHETQKPLWLMVALVEAFTDPGELVWDPYMGSGTTGVACLLTGRRFLGHEMQDGTNGQKDYVGVAVERLRAAEKGQSLAEHREGQLTFLGGP